MSEYIKLDDVKAKIREEWVKYMPTEMDMSVAFVLGKLSDLPIIEVSDSADRPFEYFEGYEDGKASVEVSEDCISRADLIQDLRKDAERVEMEEFANDTVWRTIGNAPSVIPQPKEGEWIRTGRTNIYGGIEVQCSNCGDKVMVQHLEDEWYCRHCGADMGMKGADDD